MSGQPLFWLSTALCDSGSHWLSLPLSGILWPSLAHYCSLISSLIGSQGLCSALSAAATLTHFLPLCPNQTLNTPPPSPLDRLKQAGANNVKEVRVTKHMQNMKYSTCFVEKIQVSDPARLCYSDCVFTKSIKLAGKYGFWQLRNHHCGGGICSIISIIYPATLNHF